MFLRSMYSEAFSVSELCFHLYVCECVSVFFFCLFLCVCVLCVCVCVSACVCCCVVECVCVEEGRNVRDHILLGE